MSDPVASGPAPLPWLLGAVAAVVGALWTALRASTRGELRTLRSEVAFARGELKAEREGRERDRQASAAALERLGERYDDLARLYERVCVQAATVANAAGDTYREAMPTDVRDLSDLIAKSTPAPARAATPPRLPIVREEYAPGVRPPRPR